MKVLIVDDMGYKQNEVIQCLNSKGITDYEVTSCTREAITTIINYKNNANEFDLIITDLGLPIFDDEPVNDSIEGYYMLLELAYRDIFIPAVVYSTTEVPQEELIDLREVLEYPYLGQARDIETLMLLLQIFLDDNKNTQRTRKN